MDSVQITLTKPLRYAISGVHVVDFQAGAQAVPAEVAEFAHKYGYAEKALDAPANKARDRAPANKARSDG